MAQQPGTTTIRSMWVLILAVAVGGLVVCITGLSRPGVQPEPDPYAATTALYVNPDSEVERWLSVNPDLPLAGPVRTEIASRATALWVGGGPIGSFVHDYVTAAAAVSELPVLVPYNIPSRDCGQHNAGGATDGDEYRRWIREFAAALGDRAAVVVLEPDSLLLLRPECMNDAQQQERISLLRYAVDVLSEAAPAAAVYLDGGDGAGTPPEVMAARLAAVGVDRVRGAALNVSNYNRTDDVVQYAHRLRELLSEQGGSTMRFVVDVGRNGSGPGTEWCNPVGPTLGQRPQVGGPDGIDALLWIKEPGTTDGDCGIGAGHGTNGFVAGLAEALLAGSPALASAGS